MGLNTMELRHDLPLYTVSSRLLFTDELRLYFGLYHQHASVPCKCSRLLNTKV